MAFTSIPTITTGDVATAAWGNTYLKNNFALTAPAVMTTAGDVIYASGANTPARLAKSTTSTQYLANTGTSNVPAWNEVALTTGVSGVLPVGSGGTGATSLTANGVIIGNTASALTSVDMSTKGGLLAGDGSGNPSVLALGGSANLVLTVDSGETTGMKWASAGTISIIGTTVPSSSSTITQTGMDSTYDLYMIVGSDLKPIIDNDSLHIQFGDSSGVDTGGSDYMKHSGALGSDSASYAASASGSISRIQICSQVGNATGEGAGFVLWIPMPGDSATLSLIHGTYGCIDGTSVFHTGTIGGARSAVITLDRVQIHFASGDFADQGRMTVYGVKHA